MRVLMLGWEFPPEVHGGLGTACHGMVKALTDDGVEVIFLLPHYKGHKKQMNNKLRLQSASDVVIPAQSRTNHTRQLEELWQRHCKVIKIDSLLFPYATDQSYQQYRRDTYLPYQVFKNGAEALAPAGTYFFAGGYGADLMREVYRYSQAAAITAMHEQFDIIHAHDWMTYPAALLIKQLTGKPLVIHVHALEYDRSGEHINQEIAALEQLGMEQADRIVAVSHFTRNMIIDRYHISPQKVMVVHNAVSRKEATIYIKKCHSPDEKRVLFLGRVTFQKGPDYFIEAARLVLQWMPNVRFVMAGSGDMLRRMVYRTAELRLGNRINFTGFLHGEEVDRIYATSDLYVMPSVSEPFGISPLEAMLYDVPVLISKQSGVSEVIRNALKVDFWDVREMANKIHAVLAYPGLAQEMVKKCRKELKAIKWSNAAALLKEIYSSAITEH